MRQKVRQGSRPISREAAGGKLPNFALGKRNKEFRFSHHQSSWELVKTSKGWRLAPSLSRLVVDSGVNGTAPARQRGGKPDGTRIRVKAEQSWGQTVLGGTDYLRHAEVKGSTGEGWFTAWEQVNIYADGSWEVVHDDDGFDLWRWSLVVDGVVEPPRPIAWRAQERRLTRRLARAQKSGDEAGAAKATERLAGLEEARAALEAITAPAPAPTPKRGRSRKVADDG